MPKYVAFLRAVNVGGHTVKMDYLRSLFEALGFSNVETFIASERERLNKEREAIFTQQQELEQKLAGINNELRAIDAYEAAKSGKAPARQAATRRTGTRACDAVTCCGGGRGR